MRKIFASAIAATVLLGTASVALADGYEDQAADAIRNFGPVQAHQTLTTRQVGLSKAPSAASEQWMDRASQSFGGGY